MEKHLIATYEKYAREPVLRRMKDGTLICLCLTGGEKEPANDNVVKITRSFDDGVTWSEPEVLFSHSSRACWSTEVFTECDKPFAIVQTYYAPSHYREIQTFRSYCNEDGSVWSEPVSIPGTVTGCSVRQGIRLSNGEILFPLYWQETRNNFDWGNPEKAVSPKKWPFVVGVGISTDGGESFFRHGYISVPDGSKVWEPNAVELSPGHLIMYMRCSGALAGCLYVSESFDYGRTWTAAEPTELLNADTKVTLLKVRDKVVLINNFDIKYRKHLSIAVSTDGKNFEKVAEVEDGLESWYYPHAFADDARELLYVAYENKHEHWLKKYSYAELGI